MSSEFDRSIRRKARREVMKEYGDRFKTKTVESKKRKQELSPKYEKQEIEDLLLEEEEELDFYHYYEVGDE